MRLPLIVIGLLFATMPAAATGPFIVDHDGWVQARHTVLGDRVHCATEGAAHLAMVVDGDEARFTLRGPAGCGLDSVTVRGVRDGDGWTFVPDAATTPGLVSGSFRPDENSVNVWTLRLNVGPCASGDIICEAPLARGSTYRGTFNLGTILF